MPGRPITSATTPGEAEAVGVRYLALAPKDGQAHYGRATPDLATWLADEGRPLYSVKGDSYGEISLGRQPASSPTWLPAEGHRYGARTAARTALESFACQPGFRCS